MRPLSIRDFLTKKQLADAQRLYNRNTGNFAEECAERIIAPDINQINKRLGRKNDPLFLAYVCEYAFDEAKKNV